MASGSTAADRPNFDGRVFIGTEGYEGGYEAGDFNEHTIIRYRQNGDVIWATYENEGEIFATVVGKILEDGMIECRYGYVRRTGELGSGSCSSRLEILEDGRYRLHETWREPEMSGFAILEERRD